MFCAKCERNLFRCICDDIDERIERLKQLPALAVDFDAIQAQRFLNKFEIEKDKAASIQPK